MLVAVTASGQRRVASAASRDADVLCPDCGAKLLVRLPRDRVAHFAHPSGQRCDAEVARATRRRADAERRAGLREERRRQAEVDAGQQTLF